MTEGTTDGEETVVKIDEVKTLSENTPTITGNIYAWNQKGGVTASSTGNMTGVYDLSGGTWERTASYVANGHDNLSTYGKSIAYTGDVLKTTSTKYTMVYPHDSTVEDTMTSLDVVSNANYEKNTKIYGDAIRETSKTGIDNSSWENDYSYFAGLHHPFVVRGGNLWHSSQSGRFSFNCPSGNSVFDGGFRPIVIPMS